MPDLRLTKSVEAWKFRKHGIRRLFFKCRIPPIRGWEPYRNILVKQDFARKAYPTISPDSNRDYCSVGIQTPELCGFRYNQIWILHAKPAKRLTHLHPYQCLRSAWYNRTLCAHSLQCQLPLSYWQLDSRIISLLCDLWKCSHYTFMR